MARITLPAPARLTQRATDSYPAPAQISAPLAPSHRLLPRSLARCWSLFRAVIFGIPLMLFVMCYLAGIALDDMLAAEKKRHEQQPFSSDD